MYLNEILLSGFIWVVHNFFCRLLQTYSCNFITRAFADRELDQMEDFGATRDDDTESNVTSIDAPRDVEKARDRDGSVMGV